MISFPYEILICSPLLLSHLIMELAMRIVLSCKLFLYLHLMKILVTPQQFSYYREGIIFLINWFYFIIIEQLRFGCPPCPLYDRGIRNELRSCTWCNYYHSKKALICIWFTVAPIATQLQSNCLVLREIF